MAKDFSRRPALAVVRVGDDAASEIYVRSKLRAAARLGIEDKEYHISGTRATQETVADTIGHLNADPYVDGIILQLPLPKHLNKRASVAQRDKHADVERQQWEAALRVEWRRDARVAQPASSASAPALSDLRGADTHK